MNNSEAIITDFPIDRRSQSSVLCEGRSSNLGPINVAGVKLRAANGTSHFEADVDGSNISCRLNGVELARNETAVSASVSSRAASLGMPIWLKSYVPVKISNVTIHPAR